MQWVENYFLSTKYQECETSRIGLSLAYLGQGQAAFYATRIIFHKLNT